MIYNLRISSNDLLTKYIFVHVFMYFFYIVASKGTNRFECGFQIKTRFHAVPQKRSGNKKCKINRSILYSQPMKCINVQSRIPSRNLYQSKMVSSVPSTEQKKILIREISDNVIIGTFEHNLRKVTASSHKR